MVATTNCRPADTRPLIAAPCLWEDDEVDGGAVETPPHAEEADRVRTHYHFPRTALIHSRPHRARPRHRDARARALRRVHRLIPVGPPVVRPMYCPQRLAVRRGHARERGVYS